jgi:hypothetical protein
MSAQIDQTAIQLCRFSARGFHHYALNPTRPIEMFLDQYTSNPENFAFVVNRCGIRDFLFQMLDAPVMLFGFKIK